MDGTELLKELSERIKKRRGTKTITDAVSARELGITQPVLAQWRGQELTPKKIANLIDRIEARATAHAIGNAITPIVEFFYIDPAETKQAAGWEILSSAETDSLVQRDLTASF